MQNETIIKEAEFNDSVTTYWLISGALVLIFMIFGIVLLPIWYFVGKWLTRKYLASHECILTDRSLKVSKGIFTQIEKTVPLDRITDLGIVQGPIMRWLDIEALSVETAGQSGPGSLIRSTGISDGRGFRDLVLKQRDKIVFEKKEMTSTPTAGQTTGLENETALKLLTEIRDGIFDLEAAISQGK